MRIRQIVFVATALHEAAAQLAALLDLEAPFRDPGVAEFGLDNAVQVFGDQFIEVVAPVREGTAAGRHLARRGAGGYMLILQTDDFGRERARFAALGVRTVWSAEHADMRSAHLHPKDIGGAIVSVDEPRPAAAWRWGGPQWRVSPGARGAQRIVGVTVEAHEPRVMAQRWAQVLGLPPPVAAAGEAAAWRLALHEGGLEFVPAGARGEGIAGFTLAVADRAAVLQRGSELGLPVQGDRVALLDTRIEFVPLAPQPA